MSDYTGLKNAIRSAIRENGSNEITGNMLQQILVAMVNNLGAEYQFAGVAYAAMNPGTPDYNVAYLAGPGSYPNFGNTVIPSGSIAILRYNGVWTPDVISFSGGGGGLTITIEPILTSGTKIATITINGTAYDLYAPSGGSSNVSVTPVVTSGTKIATITVNGTDTDIFAPSGSGYQPDNEDINLNANNRLQFANRASATGKRGYVILRTDESFVNQVLNDNTIYEIRYNFNLNASPVTIPQNCILLFNGGRITNGTLVCSNGVEIYNGNFLNCPLLVRGDFKIDNSHIEINSNIYNTERAGGIIAEYGDTGIVSYVEITNCRILHSKSQNVYGDCIKLIADNHSIRFNITGNYLSAGYWAGIETQSNRNSHPSGVATFCSGNFENNMVLVSGTSGEGIGVSLVALDSEVIITGNYVEAYGIGIEFADNALVSGNTVLMAAGTAAKYAIVSSLYDTGVMPKMSTITGNKVLRGRVGIQNGNVPVKIVGNEIHGTLVMDGRVHQVRDFYIQDNTVIQDIADVELPALSLYFNTSGTKGFVSGNYVYDCNPTDPIISFNGLHNCRIANNKFVFSAAKSQFIISAPDNVDFSDNEVEYSTLTAYANKYGLIEIWAGSWSAPTVGTGITLYRNRYIIGNLASIKNGSLPIMPFRDADDPFAYIYEEGTTIKDYIDRKSGTSIQRPDISLYGGVTSYFDLTLNKMIWWQQYGWWDATGNAVQ